MPFRGIPLASIFVCAAAVLPAAAPTALTIEVSVIDYGRHPVAGVEVRFQNSLNLVFSLVTDEKGRAQFTQVEPGHYEIAATKEGFEPLVKRDHAEPGAGRRDEALSQRGNLSLPNRHSRRHRSRIVVLLDRS